MNRSVTPERLAKIKHVLARRQKDLTLVLANIHDPHNVSAVYRSCDAFGVPEVQLYYTNTAFPTLGLKSSASARKWVESVRHSDPAELMNRLKQKGMQVLAAGISPTARPIIEYDLCKPTAVIFGNEHRGIDQELADLAPNQAFIPMHGMVQSLNVSVAAAVTLYEIWRQRQAKGMYDQPSYNPEEYESRIQTWCEK